MRRLGLKLDTVPKYDVPTIARIVATFPFANAWEKITNRRRAKQWRHAVRRVHLRMPYATGWFLAYCPPGGLQRLRWGLVIKYVRLVHHDPTYLHRLWPPTRPRKNTDEAKWYARQRALSLILDATHARPPDLRGAWQSPLVIDGDARRNVFATRPPEGGILTPQTCERITAATERALEQLTRIANLNGGPTSDDLGLPQVADELASIFEASTGLPADISYNEGSQPIEDDLQGRTPPPEAGFSPFVLFVAAALEPLSALHDEYRQRFAPRPDDDERKRLNTLGHQLARARRSRCEWLEWPTRCTELADARSAFPNMCLAHAEKLRGSCT